MMIMFQDGSIVNHKKRSPRQIKQRHDTSDSVFQERNESLSELFTESIIFDDPFDDASHAASTNDKGTQTAGGRIN